MDKKKGWNTGKKIISKQPKKIKLYVIAIIIIITFACNTRGKNDYSQQIGYIQLIDSGLVVKAYTVKGVIKYVHKPNSFVNKNAIYFTTINGRYIEWSGKYLYTREKI